MCRPGALLYSLVLLVVCVMGVGLRADAYEAAPVQNAGTISGVVKLVGAVPPTEQLEITKDQATCGTQPRPSEALVVAPDTGIKNVVVSLIDISRGKAQLGSQNNPTLTQEQCWFSPRVLLVPAGSKIDLLNHDNVMHNIHTVSQANPVINKAHPTFRKKLSFALQKPEMVQAKCDIHPWMSAWFVVTEHPYVTVTEANGSFTLTDVPPGTYTLQAWHETLGKQTQQVGVAAQGESKVVFEMKR